MLINLAGFAQVPAGHPYQAEKHPNPILTFVGNDDFESTIYEEARESGGVELLGLSADEGT